MTEALRLGFGLILLGGLLFGFAYVARSLIRDRIPQDEIDTEARELIAAHGVDAVSVAQGNVERSQWGQGEQQQAPAG